jgi:hypothetical protein
MPRRPGRIRARKLPTPALFRAVHDALVNFVCRFERLFHVFFSSARVNYGRCDRDGLNSLRIGYYRFVRHIHSASSRSGHVDCAEHTRDSVQKLHVRTVHCASRLESGFADSPEFAAVGGTIFRC